MMKKKTIIHVAPFAIWTRGKGVGMPSVYRGIKGLADNGYDNIYITDSPYANPDDDSEPGIEVIKIKNPYAYTGRSGTKKYRLYYFTIVSLRFIFQTIKQARNRNVEVVYSHHITLAFVGYLLSTIFKAKYVLRLYGIGLPSAPGKRDLTRKQAFWYPADLYIITDDGSNGYEYATRRGVPPHKIAFLRNGIDKPENLTKDERLYKELAPNNEKLLLSTSRLAYSKNVDKIIEGFYEVSKVLPNVRLVIVGGDKERNALENLVYRLGISDRVSFVGAILQKDVFRYQSVADIFISMNEISSFCNVVFEAMSCGKCIITLDRSNTRELIKDGENGIVINSYDELKDAIIKALSDTDMAARLGLEAKKTISKWYSWEERVQKEVEIINNLCENKTPLIPSC